VRIDQILALLQAINTGAVTVGPIIGLIKGGQAAGVTDEQLQAQMEAFLAEALEQNASDMDPKNR
jgi:hypothetical protein